MSQAVATTPILDDVQTFEQAMEAFASAGVAVTIVNPNELIDDKDTLIGVPFLIIAYRFNPEGDYGEFVSVMAITQENRRIIFNDGSTGIRLQLKELETKGIHTAILCKDGLRRSDFRHINGEVIKRSDERYRSKDAVPASTYYLS